MKKYYAFLFILPFISLTFQRSLACEANFTWTTDGLTINLDASGSTGDISSWLWLINGDVFSDAHPTTHTVVSEYGEYQICLIISNGGGCSDTLCQTVNVEQQNTDCAAHFSWWTEGLTIHLNGNDSEGDVTSWSWYKNEDLFSDAGPETSITVDAYGEYEICLVIQTASGCIDTLCQTIHVEQNNDCAAHFTWWTDGFTIHLNGSDSEGDVTSWSWYKNEYLFSDAGPETSITVDTYGEYEICLVIQTASGCIDTLCQTIHVEQNNDCAAHFSWWTDGLTVHVNGSESDGDVISWHWYLDSDLVSDDGPESHFTVDDYGEYEVCLVIETTAGCVDTLCQTIHVEQQNGDCAAHFSWSTDGLTINVNGSESSGDVVSWRWYLNGDLFSEDGPESHVTVDEYGEYQICLVIETASGCIDTLCQTVHVEQQNGDCTAHFSWSIDGLTINVNGSESSGDVVSWHWYLDGDLFSDDGPESHVTVDEYGEYEICLITETADGCVDTLCQTIHVEQENSECEANFTWETDGLTIYLNGESSSGEILHWSWYINGNFFSDSHPETHTTVDGDGTYEICLVIQADGGCTDTLCQEITVQQEESECEANFTWDTDGFTINLDGSSSTGEILHWSWFINGDFFSDAHPETHIDVGESGTYIICLAIHADGECDDTLCQEVVVEGFQGNGGYDFKMMQQNDGSIVMQVSTPEDGNMMMVISEVSGKKVFEDQEYVNQGSSQHVLTFGSTLSSGIYLATLYMNGEFIKSEKIALLK